MIKQRRFMMCVMFLVLVFLTACSAEDIPNAKNWDVAEFQFIDQESKGFAKSDLTGKVWIADFIFTSCEDVCLPMTANMAKLQTMLKDEGIKDVEFVSFSVDPEVDKPARLQEYGNQFNADYENWHFLTGYEQEEIERLALNSFKTFVVKPENQDQVTHGTYFYLVNQEGKVVQYYSGLEKIPFEDIIEHIKILQKS